MCEVRACVETATFTLSLQQLMNAIVMVHKMQRLALTSTSMDVDLPPASVGGQAQADEESAAGDHEESSAAKQASNSCSCQTPRNSEGKSMANDI